MLYGLGAGPSLEGGLSTWAAWALASLASGGSPTQGAYWLQQLLGLGVALFEARQYATLPALVQMAGSASQDPCLLFLKVGP